MKKSRVVVGLFLLAVALVGAIFIFGRKGKPGDADEKLAAKAEKKERQPRSSGGDGPRETPSEGRVLVGDDPRGTLRIEGQVVDESEQPVGAATVRITSNPPRELTAEGDGSFVFDGLLPREYTLIASDAERASGTATVTPTDKTEPVILRLQAGATLEVTVVSAKDRAPIADAEVEARGLVERAVRTGADGKALVKGLGSADLVVKVSARGFAPAWRYTNVNAGGGARRETIELQPGAPVSGTVVDPSGKPLAGAQVTVEAAGELFTPSDPRKDAVITDAKGAWTFPAVQAGSVRFAARHDAHAPGVSEPITLDGQTEKSGVLVKLEPAARLAGRVVRPGGQPAPFATVRVASASRFGWEPTVQRACDADGRFDIGGLARVPVDVVASDEGAASKVVSFDLARTPEQTGVEIVLDVDGVIAGTVVTTAGEPVAEAAVSAFPDIFGAGGGIDKMEELRLRGIARTISDAGGKFELRGLPAGKYQLRAGRGGPNLGRMLARRSTDAKTGDTSVKLILDPDGGVKGRVQLAEGGAPQAFSVRVGMSPPTPYTGGDGDFRVGDIEPGKHTLVVSGAGFVEKKVDDVLVESGKDADVGVVVVAMGRAVNGRVVDAAGAPVEGAAVFGGGQLFGSGASLKAGFAGDRIRETVSAPDGTFTIGGLGDKAIDLAADHAEKGRSNVTTVPAGRDSVTVELKLLAPGSLGGKVTKGAAPVANAAVMLTPRAAAKSRFVVTAGPDGVYRFERLAAGEYVVYAVEASMGGGGGESSTVTIAPGQDVTKDVQLPEGGVTVMVKVTAAGETTTIAQAFLFGGETVVADDVADLETALAARAGGGGLYQHISMGGGDVKLEKVQPGKYTLCAFGLTLNPMSPRMQELQSDLAQIPLKCVADQTVAAAPDTQTFTVDAPPLPPDPVDVKNPTRRP